MELLQDVKDSSVTLDPDMAMVSMSAVSDDGYCILSEAVVGIPLTPGDPPPLLFVSIHASKKLCYAENGSQLPLRHQMGVFDSAYTVCPRRRV